MSATTVEARTFTTVLGERREATRFYGDGSCDCPFCWAAVVFPATECPNPGCDSSPRWRPEALRAELEKRAARQAEEEARKRNHRLAMERIAADNARHAEWERETLAEADRRGACRLCVFGAGWERARFIRHRAGHPHSKRATLAADRGER